MKREAAGHSKMKRLCRKLNLQLWQGMGLLEAVWHLTAREAPRGDIGKLSNEDIALAIDYRGDENELVDALVHSEWLERHQTHRLIVHDWDEHADDAVQVKLCRARLHFANGQPPRFAKLGKNEKAEAMEFYLRHPHFDEVCAQNAIPCAQVDNLGPLRAPGVRTNGEFVTPIGSLPVPVPVPEPEPVPDPAPAAAPAPKPKPKSPPQSPPPPKKIPKIAEWPLTDDVITEFHPDTDFEMRVKIIHACVQAFVNENNADAGLLPIDDKILSETLRETHKPVQTSAALWLKTAPTAVANEVRSDVRKSLRAKGL